MLLSRRRALFTLGGLIAAPAVVKASSLMKIVAQPRWDWWHRHLTVDDIRGSWIKVPCYQDLLSGMWRIDWDGQLAAGQLALVGGLPDRRHDRQART